MFRSARLKLTAWYLLIIMVISFAFSMALYRGITFELESRFAHMEWRLQAEGMRLPPHGPMGSPFFSEDLGAAKNRVSILLLYANGVILMLSGAAGYFLAGRTLRPIEEMVEEQNRFVTDSSHELRTPPLTSLKTSIEVSLRDKSLDLKEAKTLLASNLEEVNNLQSLSNDLIRLTQHQETDSSLTFETISLREVIQAALKKVGSLAKQKKITFQDETTDHKLEGDFESLVDLFVILLDNAIKFSPPKKQVSLTSRALNHSIAIEVKDEGAGISAEDLPHIFDRFYRVDKSRTKGTAHGYGIGLSIAKKIVEQHKGSIDVKSTPGQGSTFTIRLPVKKPR